MRVCEVKQDPGSVKQSLSMRHLPSWHCDRLGEIVNSNPSARTRRRSPTIKIKAITLSFAIGMSLWLINFKKIIAPAALFSPVVYGVNCTSHNYFPVAQFVVKIYPVLITLNKT